MSNEVKWSRRAWLSRSLVVLAAGPALAACGGDGELACDQTEGLNAQQRASRTGLRYAEVAANPARACHLCTLFAGTASACGTCTAVPGPIHPHGTCDGFVARS